MAKYTGHLKPKNFEIFRDLLADNGMAHLADRFLIASGRLQVMCYKEEIEAALRTPGFGGFQLLDLHDFPGQGTALVGVLDPFWDPKPYITADGYRSFCGPITPLARFDRRAFEGGEAFEADVEVAQFGPSDLADARVRWSLTRDDGEQLATGEFGPMTMPAGELVRVGSIQAPLAADGPSKATLRVEVEGADAANAWDVWIYPREADTDPPPGVLVARSLDDAAESHLEDGGTVLLLADPEIGRAHV